MSRFRLGLVLVVMASLLAGCGVRGSLEAPPEDQISNSDKNRKPGEPEEHRPFILDRLIR